MRNSTLSQYLPLLLIFVLFISACGGDDNPTPATPVPTGERLARVNYVDPSEDGFTIDVSYNDQNKIDTMFYSQDGALIGRAEIVYTNNMATQSIYELINNEWDLENTNVVTLDSDGRVLQYDVTNFDSGGNISGNQTYTFTYIAEGLKTYLYELDYDGDGIPSRTISGTVEWNNGQLVSLLESITMGSGESNSMMEFEYENELLNKITSTDEASDGMFYLEREVFANYENNLLDNYYVKRYERNINTGITELISEGEELSFNYNNEGNLTLIASAMEQDEISYEYESGEGNSKIFSFDLNEEDPHLRLLGILPTPD